MSRLGYEDRRDFLEECIAILGGFDAEDFAENLTRCEKAFEAGLLSLDSRPMTECRDNHSGVPILACQAAIQMALKYRMKEWDSAQEWIDACKGLNHSYETCIKAWPIS